MLNDFIVRHKSTFSDFMEIYVEIFSTRTEFFSKCSSETFEQMQFGDFFQIQFGNFFRINFGIFFRMRFRNCTKCGKANAEIFSELAWNNFRIRVVVSYLNSEYLDNSEFFSGVNSDNSDFFPGVIRSIHTFPKFFPVSIRNSELFSELYAKII